MDESSARRVVLVQAIETVHNTGTLLGPAEREQIDGELQAQHALAPPQTGEDGMAALLAERASKVLALVESRDPHIAAFQHPSRWLRWLTLGIPALTLLLGLLTDRIADPHEVDLLSQPLLAIVAWNLVMYGVLLVHALLPQRDRRPGLLDDLRRSAAGVGVHRPAGRLRAEIAISFLRQWQRATARLDRWRVARVLHLAAAGWAAGVALSLIARGAVVEYHVGWESTWFDAPQVHAFLKVLLMPAVTLLGVAPLSLEEVAQLELSRNSVAEAGRRWVYL